MSSPGNQTLDRIQQEIQESLRRDEELRRGYARTASNFESNVPPEPQSGRNGYAHSTGSLSPPPQSPSPVLSNGTSPPNGNGFRRFTPNPSTKGVMQKFLRMRGKVNMSAMIKPTTPAQTTAWTISDPVFDPAKVTIEPGKSLRNGFIPAEEKMRRELREFQEREAELRKERRKSQPDLMAALETEIETNLKPARSMVQMYNSTEDLSDDVFSAPGSLKPARSLADLCDASDDELDAPGTHSLIMQFESLGNHQARA